ncbi:MAG: glycosyltransferase [Tannerellaceae bacterium]
MKHRYIFYETSKAAAYGIGTYIQEQIKAYAGNSEERLSVVELHSEKEEVCVDEKAGFTHYFIPTNTERGNMSDYYQGAWYVLCQYIDRMAEDGVIFHLNFHHQYPLVERIRRDFPHSIIQFAIHYQTWCFALNGNLKQFKYIIDLAQAGETLTSFQQEVWSSFLSEKKLFQAVDVVICLSRFTQHLLISLYGIAEEKTRLVYNTLNEEVRLLSKAEKEALKQKYFFSPDEKLILFVGRLDEMKGLSFLIKAFICLQAVCPNSRLIVVGDGSFQPYLEASKGYWGKIIFTGKLPKEELYTFYQIVDVGVMVSFHEQCSYVALEMLQFQLPLIGTDRTGLKEMGCTEFVSTKEDIDSVTLDAEDIAERLTKVLMR